MKDPNDVFREFLKQHGLHRIAWEVHAQSNGRFFETNDKIFELRKKLIENGISPHISNSLSVMLVEAECVRLVAEDAQKIV
jgi:hypothetical protein